MCGIWYFASCVLGVYITEVGFFSFFLNKDQQVAAHDRRTSVTEMRLGLTLCQHLCDDG